MKSHDIGDYLKKDGNIYKIEPFQAHNEDLTEYGLLSTFLKTTTNKMFCTPFLIARDDSSFIPATKEEKESFDRIEKQYS